MPTHPDADEVLAATSRTFSIPINGLPTRLREAVSAAYLCFRAIDEIEDHRTLGRPVKAALLRGVSRLLQGPFDDSGFLALFRDHRLALPEVTHRIVEWATLPPPEIAPRVWDATAAMADRMAEWAAADWSIRTESDLDRYTFGVAGAVGLLLCDLWAWHDQTSSRRDHAVAFGSGLQAVNILRNHDDDLARGVDFFPDGWGGPDMGRYARAKLVLADRYTQALPPGPARAFCETPLALAYATLDTLERGAGKLTRADVGRIVHEAQQRAGRPTRPPDGCG